MSCSLLNPQPLEQGPAHSQYSAVSAQGHKQPRLPSYYLFSVSLALPCSSHRSFCLVLSRLHWSCLRAFALPTLSTWHFLPQKFCMSALHLVLWASAKVPPHEKALLYPSYLKHLFLTPTPRTCITFPHLFFCSTYLSIA